MNKERREAIQKAQGMVAEAKAILETARDEEQEYFDNMPGNMQNGEKGEQASQYAERLGEFCDQLEEIENEDFGG